MPLGETTVSILIYFSIKLIVNSFRFFIYANTHKHNNNSYTTV